MREIVCGNCGGTFLETTGKYRSNVQSNGSMFKVKKQYESWSCFPFHSGMRLGDLVCPGCDIIISDVNGIVKAEGDWCETCGKQVINGLHDCGEKSEMDKLFEGYNPDVPESKTTDEIIMVLHAQGLKPGEIGATVGMGHQKVAAIVRRLER